MKKCALHLLCFCFILFACLPTTSTPTQISNQSTPTLTPTAIPTRTQTPTKTLTATPTPLKYISHLDIFFANQKIFEELYLAHGLHGVYIHEIGSPDFIEFGRDLQLHGASTIKIPIAVAVLIVAEKNGWNLDTYIPPDQSLTLAELIEKMIVMHDGWSTNHLINFINDQGYRFDDELEKMGFVGFNINHRLTTASALGNLLERLSADTLGLQHNQFILDLMAMDSALDTRTFPWAINDTLPGSYANMLGAIYNYDIQVTDMGLIKYVAADCGLWTTPDGHRFVVVLIGNYGSESDFLLSNGFIHQIVTILSDLVSN